MEKEDEEENTQHRFILKAKILNFIIFIVYIQDMYCKIMQTFIYCTCVCTTYMYMYVHIISKIHGRYMYTTYMYI